MFIKCTSILSLYINKNKGGFRGLDENNLDNFSEINHGIFMMALVSYIQLERYQPRPIIS